MQDHQAIVDNIRGFLAGSDQTSSPELAEWAVAYATYCNDANARLRRSVDYLRRGLRSEAIHMAEIEPRLLDFTATLDLPEIEAWESLCGTYGLQRPPRLAIEAAQELNEAYAIEQPLRSLLTQHRMLALARAPLVDRLQVLH